MVRRKVLFQIVWEPEIRKLPFFCWHNSERMGFAIQIDQMLDLLMFSGPWDIRNFDKCPFWHVPNVDGCFQGPDLYRSAPMGVSPVVRPVAEIPRGSVVFWDGNSMVHQPVCHEISLFIWSSTQPFCIFSQWRLHFFVPSIPHFKGMVRERPLFGISPKVWLVAGWYLKFGETLGVEVWSFAKGCFAESLGKNGPGCREWLQPSNRKEAEKYHL